MNIGNALILVGREIGRIAAFGVMGFVIGVAARQPSLRAILGWKGLKRVLTVCGCLLAVIAILILIVSRSRVFPQSALAEPEAIRVEQRAEVDYDARRQVWHVAEIARTNSDDVEHYCGRRPQDNAEMNGRNSAGAQEPQWLFEQRVRNAPARKALDRLLYTEQIATSRLPLPGALTSCLNSHDIRLELTGYMKLRVPERTVRSTYPPADPKRIPGNRVEYVIEVPPGDDVQVEMIHPWLRNELGDTVLTWNLYTMLKWLVLATVALFAEQIKARFLGPIATFRWWRRTKRPAGF